jgi:hypothetical protein
MPLTPAALQKAFKPVLRAAARLPGIAESTSYGTPALKVGGKLLARLKEDGASIVVRMDFDSRDLLLKTQPKIFYLTDHYRGYPAVLVRLAATSPTRLRAILTDAWELVAPKARRR